MGCPVLATDLLDIAPSMLHESLSSWAVLDATLRKEIQISLWKHPINVEMCKFLLNRSPDLRHIDVYHWSPVVNMSTQSLCTWSQQLLPLQEPFPVFHGCESSDLCTNDMYLLLWSKLSCFWSWQLYNWDCSWCISLLISFQKHG